MLKDMENFKTSYYYDRMPRSNKIVEDR